MHQRADAKLHCSGAAARSGRAPGACADIGQVNWQTPRGPNRHWSSFNPRVGTAKRSASAAFHTPQISNPVDDRAVSQSKASIFAQSKKIASHSHAAAAKRPRRASYLDHDDDTVTDSTSDAEDTASESDHSEASEEEFDDKEEQSEHSQTAGPDLNSEEEMEASDSDSHSDADHDDPDSGSEASGSEQELEDNGISESDAKQERSSQDSSGIKLNNGTVVHKPLSESLVANELIYFRMFSVLTAERSKKLKALLRADHPGANVILDAQPTKTLPFQKRAGLSRLLQKIMDGQVDVILIESATQICNTKEAFQLFEWICHMNGVEVQVTPSLELP